MKKRQEINLVLSGGSARGLAHIGALSVLEKHFEIKSIISTSMGAIIGGLYAYGYSPKEIAEVPKTLNLLEKASLLKPSFTSSGLNNGKGFLNLLEEKTENATIEDCKIPFAAIAFDLLSRRSVIIDRGNIAKAMRSSSSLPFVFQPYAYGKHLFVDGFIEHPLPVKFAKYFETSPITVACSVLPPVPLQFEKIDISIDEPEEFSMPKALDVFFQTNLYSQGSIAVDALLHTRPEIYISAFTDKLKLWELDEVDQFFELGRESAEQAVSDYFSDNEQKKTKSKLEELSVKFSKFRELAKKPSEK